MAVLIFVVLPDIKFNKKVIYFALNSLYISSCLIALWWRYTFFISLLMTVYLKLTDLYKKVLLRSELQLQKIDS